MGRSIDYDIAKEILQQTFARAEEDFRRGVAASVPRAIAAATERLFDSATQAYREGLIGCALAKIIDPNIDIRLPYVNQGESAFNGRTLDERVVNPFLQDHAVPCSGGPYLSAFRRNIRFYPETAKGLRDKAGYDAFLTLVEFLQRSDEQTASGYLQFLLRGFVQLRDAAQIELRHVARLSVEQLAALIDGLLRTPSGGLIPVLLSVAILQTIRDCYDLNWNIRWQGINAPDRAAGVGGDIVIARDDAAILALEITERPIERARVVTTFNTKIAPQGIDDYLFIFTAQPPTDEAREQARRYFAAGHEINFANVQDWIIALMATIGPRCRANFLSNMLALLNARGVPAAVKVAWNEQLVAVVG